MMVVIVVDNSPKKSRVSPRADMGIITREIADPLGKQVDRGVRRDVIAARPGTIVLMYHFASDPLEMHKATGALNVVHY